MQIRRDIMIFAVASAGFFWIADSINDHLAHHFERNLIHILFFSGREVLYRLVVVSIILVMGAVLSRMFSIKELDKSAISESEARYRSLVESTEDSIYLVDRYYRYLFLNARHLARLGLRKDQLLGRSYGDFHSPDDTKDFVDNVEDVLRRGESIQREHRSRRDEKYFLRTFSPVRGDSNEIVAVTVISKDISDLKRMEAKLNSLSITDELTGLYNRRGFFALAEQQIKISKRTSGPLLLLYADLDNLKKINDTYGHKVGDTALIQVSHVLRDTFRDSDIIARLGGDEFAVMQMDVSLVSTENIVTRLQQNLNGFNERNSMGYTLSVSAGVVFYSSEMVHDIDNVDEMLSRADRLMYEEKFRKQKIDSTKA